MATDKHPCGHATCECLIEGASAFCSSYCAEAASAPIGSAAVVCECGHRSCAVENANALRPYGSVANVEASGHTGSRSRASTGRKGDSTS